MGHLVSHYNIVTDYPSMGNHHPHSTPLATGMDSKDIKMLEEQTHLKQEEILEQYAKFKGATSGEDVMSRSVFSKIMKTCYPRTYKPELEEDIFRIYDVDNSGTIEFKEFLVIVCVMSQGSPQAKLRQIFRIFDTDNNGVISVDELNNIVEHLFHLVPDGQKHHLETPASIADCLMTEMDTDQDGVVSEEELVTAFMRSEKLTTTLVNKIMTRFTSASVKILSD